MVEIVVKKDVGAVYKSKECLPCIDMLLSMYADGFRMYLDGKKLTKQEMIDFVKASE